MLKIIYLFILFITITSCSNDNNSIENNKSINNKVNKEKEIILTDNIKVKNSFEPSHEICYKSETKIIKNGIEELILYSPSNDKNNFKLCSFDIKKVSEKIIRIPVCYEGGAGSGECSIVILDYNIITNEWLLKSSHHFNINGIKQLNELLENNSNILLKEDYFNINFYKFITYFINNYNLINTDIINDKYIDKSFTLNINEKNKILNTIAKLNKNEIEILKYNLITNNNEYANIAYFHYLINQNFETNKQYKDNIGINEYILKKSKK